MGSLRTNLYVDGFNLYYGAAKHTSFKWVNVVALAQTVLPNPGLTITRTRYFTALVKADASDLQKRQRQETYIRALETLPNLSVHHGHYLRSIVTMRLETPPPVRARVIKMEEKGSDVNLATYMLVDAFRNDCDQLVVITNDSDLAEPVRIINKELGLPVVVLNPHAEDTAARNSVRLGQRVKAAPSVALRKVARFTKDIRSGGSNNHMAQSQFPQALLDSAGRTITKPTDW